MAFPKTLDTNDPQAVYRFIGGRRNYNAQRQFRAIDRQFRLLYEWAKNPHLRQADLARKLGVSRSTITRDIQALKEKNRRHKTCPLCRGMGRLDTGPGPAETMEFISEVAQTFGHLLED